MNRIISPLRYGTQGPAVADLQDALQQCLDRGALYSDDEGARRRELSAVLKCERIEQTYGDATAKLVARFQEERRLQVSGEVDEPTASALNALLREWGLLSEAPVSAFQIVTGAVRREDGIPLQGVQVRAVHQAEQGAIRLGADTTDAEGRYTIRYERLPGVDAINLRVTALGDDGQPLQTSEVVRNAKLIESIDLIVPVTAAPADRQRIEGTIILEHGLPAENLKLRLYRRDFGGQATLLGEAMTLAGGRYAFDFDTGSRAASLEVRAVKGDGTEIPLSKPLNELSPDARVSLNLVSPGSLQPLAPEYRRLSVDLTPLVGQMTNLARAKENTEQQDLTVLHRATGWDARLIALSAVTERLAADADVQLPQEALYGLLRVGLPSDKLLLAQVEPDVAEQALKKARDAGIVQLSDDQIGQFKTDFGSFANKTRLNLSAPGSRSTYGELLQSSGLPQDVRDKFALVYLKHRGSGAQLWDEAGKAGLDDAQIGRLQLQGRLAYLAGNSETMTTRLLNKGLKDPVDLVDQDFHRPDAWVNEVFEQADIPQERRASLTADDRSKLDAVIPTAFGGKTVEARLETYAEDMARKMRLSYPTQVLGRLMETDEKYKLPSNHDATVALLKNATAQGFRFGETPVATFLRSRSGVHGGLSDTDFHSAGQQMEALQRMYQITPGNEAIPVLMALNMTSAFDVTAYPEERFIALFEAKYLDIYKKPAPPGVPTLVSRKARQVSSVTYNLFAIAKTADNLTPLGAVSGTPEQYSEAKNKLKGALKEYPTMESLFGSLDYCECEHCRSVLSPAAYFVDLLQFVDTEPEVWGNFLEQWKKTHGNQEYPHVDAGGNPMKPYDVLIERRPDLPHIALTCENTNTALPYIDIVNEILEYHVARGKLEGDAAHDTGAASTADLLAEPQNVIREAYDKLEQARYPLNLSFDLWIETVRQFCDYFESPLHEVLEAFRPGDELFAPGQPFDRAAIFMESLSLSPAEAAIFTNSDPLSKWYELYGFATDVEATSEATDPVTGQRIDLNSAKALSRRLGVTYREIMDVVQTGFVNPELTKLDLLYKLDVNVGDVRLYKDHGAFYEQNKDLIGKQRDELEASDQQRFDELAKKVPDTLFTGWHIVNELDAFEQRLDDLSKGFETSPDDLKAAVQAIPFERVLVLADLDTGCNFDQTILRYADGAKADPIVFLRINLFVRLWRKLGWSIEETDRALQTFVPKNTPFDADHLDQQPLKTALIYLAHLKALDEKLKVAKQNRLALLTLWSDIATTGKQPLYAQLFLTRSVLKSAPLFDHPLGKYLQYFDNTANEYRPFHWNPGQPEDPAAGNVSLRANILALQGALGLTADEISRILKDAGKPPDTAELSLLNVSLLYRHGLLAKALKLTVRELIVLKQLSGINPFTPLHESPLNPLDDTDSVSIELDHPFSQTLEFVKVAEEVKDSGLKIEDLDYLFRHRFDEAGKYRPDREGRLALLKSLAEGVRAIRAEHAVPGDPGSLSDDALRQKLGLVLPPDVIERFVAILNATAEFSVTKSIANGNQLDPADFAGEPAIGRLAYNALKQEQTIVFRGVLFDAKKTELKDKFNGRLTDEQRVTLGTLLDDVQVQSRELAKEFFARHLEKRSLHPLATFGFLEEKNFDELFVPLPEIDDNLTAEQKTAARQDIEAKRKNKLTILSNAFFPFLQQRLIRQFVVQTMTAQTGADPALVESLLTDDRLLKTPDSNPLLDAFTSVKDIAGNLLRPAGADSVRLDAYLEVPITGAYRFYVELDKQNAEAELRFPHRPEPVLVTHDKPDEYLELKAGVLYRFTLDLKNLNGGDARLLVQGETLSKGPLSRLTLYPAGTIDAAEHAVTLLNKALQLVQGLGLSEREIRYLLIHATDFGDLSLSELPTDVAGDTPAEQEAATKRFGWFRRLAAYARLKRDLAGGTDDLIGIFEANPPAAATAEDMKDRLEKQVYPLIAKLTRRDEATTAATAEALFTAPAFASEKPLQRLWEALQVVERFGVSLASLLAWTGIVRSGTPAEQPEQRFAIARDLKEAIKARFEPETWQRVAQPIFDKLRQRQRDALVSHVLQQLRTKPETAHIDTQEKLYEYFLIDPGMEPVVQTSRIRLAIASLQLFIQRSLLNLEPRVHPSTINAKHWEWMKRYRVWEANRKIFLFPENWLEPEFRDDKTHLFAELEGALLQGDVSSDLVEDAFLNYLKKLDELARLDLVAMHIEDDADPARRILHVFGRTFGQPHQYFYRRYARQTWTPWEPVTAEIQGDHLAPVVWRDRLYLFWVTFLEKAEQPAGDKKIDNPTEGITIEAVRKNIEVQLHWSEYLQGEWSTGQSSQFFLVMTSSRLMTVPVSSSVQIAARQIGVTSPSHEGTIRGWPEWEIVWVSESAGGTAVQSDKIPLSVPSNFSRAKVFIHVSKEYENGKERGVYIHLTGPKSVLHSFRHSFYVAGRNSGVAVGIYENPPANPYGGSASATRYSGGDPLKVSYHARISTQPEATPPPANPNILQQGGGYSLLPSNNNLTLLSVPEDASSQAADPAAVEVAIESGLSEIAPLIKPVFYQDDRHTFFVEPEVSERTIEEWQEWVTTTPQPGADWKTPDWWQELVVMPVIPQKWPILAPSDSRPVLIDPSSLITPLPDRDWLVNPGSVVKFSEVLIDRNGQLQEDDHE